MPLVPIGCMVQFHVKPSHPHTWGKHSTDGWYIGAFPEHYRTHHIFVKAFCSHCLSDTVYFKHKYITQPTVTTADDIVKALQVLMATLKDFTKLKGQQNLDTLTKLKSMLSPPVTPLPHSPRVNFRNTVQLCTFNPDRVTPVMHLPPPQLIVESLLATAKLPTPSGAQRPL